VNPNIQSLFDQIARLKDQVRAVDVLGRRNQVLPGDSRALAGPAGPAGGRPAPEYRRSRQLRLPER
jgi:hypothetical protein